MSGSDLGEILGEEAAAEPVETDTPEPQEVAAEPTGETEDSTPEPQEAEPTPKAEDAETRVPLQALINERQQRQDLQRQLDSMRQQEAETPPPDVFEDQGAFVDHMEARFAERLAAVERATDLRVARIQWSDYDEKAGKFVEMAESDPGLMAQAQAAGNIPEFAYNYVTQQEKIALANDPDHINSLVEERAKALAEEMMAQQAKQALDDAQPPSLSGNPAAQGQTGTKPFEPTSLENIIG